MWEAAGLDSFFPLQPRCSLLKLDFRLQESLGTGIEQPKLLCKASPAVQSALGALYVTFVWRDILGRNTCMTLHIFNLFPGQERLAGCLEAVTEENSSLNATLQAERETAESIQVKPAFGFASCID